MNKSRKTTVFHQPRIRAYCQSFVAAFCALLLTGLGSTEQSAQVTITPKTMVDIYFLADTTGSMSAPISSVKAGATEIMNSLISSFPDTDLAFGVGDYKDFPHEPYAFQSMQSLTTDTSVVQTALNGWNVSGGSDSPEAQLYALDRIANAPSIGWRTDAKQIVLWFGDCPGHDPVPIAATKLSYDITKESVITDLSAAGIIILAISTDTGCSGKMDSVTSGGDYNKIYGAIERNYTNQATDISIATGGYHHMDANSDVIVDTIKSLLSTTVNIVAKTEQLLAIKCTQLPEVECKGLVEIYFRTKGYYWKEGWSAEQTHCEWKGITCQDGHVTQINLNKNNLKGTIPPSIGYYFSKLSILDLANNKLSGAIPFSLGHSSQLQTLALNNNQLNGSIPGSIGYIKQLQTLNLNDNQLSGYIPKLFEKLQQLQRLDISNNQFTGMSPAFLNDLKQLVHFDWAGNQFIVGSTICPKSVGIPRSECNALVHFYNSTDGQNWKDNTGWNVTKAACSWKGVSCSDGYVTKIELNDNKLKGSIPKSIGKLGKLTFLSLRRNQLGGPIPKSIGKLGKLTSLDLGGNKLGGSIPESIGNLGKLIRLDLGSNKLDGPIPESIGNLGGVTYLSLNNNKLGGPIPESIGNLSNLRWLYLSNNKLGGSIPESIGNLGKLTYLSLYNNKLGGPIPKSLANLNNLGKSTSGKKRLYVSGNKFSCDEIPSSLNPEDCPLKKKKASGKGHLGVSGNKFSCDEIPSLLNPEDCPLKKDDTELTDDANKMSTTTMISVAAGAAITIGLVLLFLL
ncbi:hypothetical protein [Candidatus Parabeggiatoa sp. HSG14]|uniref:hypothetical protein n=1 Tax=Candidatus Parabeggiatoa sp. HSG14 TaxID=3055593 RepID=UPI0025A7F60A|nr:hypothetical protein [Thiotrichales bacterium HSG14]